MILDGFYTVFLEKTIDTGFEWQIQLNSSHKIYQAHFPGNPITPGVCMLQICQDAVSKYYNQKLRMTEAKNIKFLHVLSPIEHEMVTFTFQCTQMEAGVKVMVSVTDGDDLFAKFSLMYV